MNNPEHEVGNAIRSLREACGLTQLAFLPVIGTSLATLSRFESGTNLPKPGTLLRLHMAAKHYKREAEAQVFKEAIGLRAGKHADRITFTRAEKKAARQRALTQLHQRIDGLRWAGLISQEVYEAIKDELLIVASYRADGNVDRDASGECKLVKFPKTPAVLNEIARHACQIEQAANDAREQFNEQSYDDITAFVKGINAAVSLERNKALAE